METYKIGIEEKNPIVVDGLYVTKIKSKHIKNYGDAGSNNIFQNAINMFERSQQILKNKSVSNNLLVVGKVQSGKTANLEMFTAIAFDNGYNAVFIYGGYDKTLLAQTKKRFEETFDIVEEDISSDTPALFATDGESIDDLDEDILDEILESEKPVIFVSMKRPQALNRINSMIKKLNVSKINSFIIDDEGDQASLNGQFKKNKKSPTYESICQMKDLLNDPLYLSVTATPQANIFQYELSKLTPSDVKLISPGNGYTGAEVFHLRENNIYKIDANEIVTNNKINDSLRNAIYYFFISSAIMQINGLTYSDMIIHSDRSINAHSELYTTINSTIQNMKDEIHNNGDDVALYLEEIGQVYTDDFFSKDILEKYTYDQLSPEIIKVIKKTYIVLQNSMGKETMTNSQYKNHKIYIGGDLLQRGVTFKYLVTTYFTRWAKTGNMDTTLQRGRWFGYRGKYLDLCKIFTTKEIMAEFSGIATMENDLWNQFESIENGEMVLSDIIVDASETSLNPTRKSIGHFKKVAFRNKWYNQRVGIFEPQKVKYNNLLIDSILNDTSVKWIDTSAGRTDGKKSKQYTYVSFEVIKKIIEQSREIFSNKPFGIKNLLKSIKGSKIALIKMFNEDEPLRKRTFTNNCVSALQQGADKVDINERKYLGDSYVIVDEEAVNIQLFKIEPKEINDSKDYIQYMFSFHFPKENVGFVKVKKP